SRTLPRSRKLHVDVVLRHAVALAVLRDEIANSIDAAALQRILTAAIAMASLGGGLQHLMKIRCKDDSGAAAVRCGDLLTEVSAGEAACTAVQLCVHLLEHGDAAREDNFLLPDKSK